MIANELQTCFTLETVAVYFIAYKIFQNKD